MLQKQFDMNIAVVTANTGRMDAEQIFFTQSIPCNRYVFTDANLPFPLPNLNARLRGKYVKTKTHKFLPGYDYYVWVDSRLGIVSETFVDFMIKGLRDADIFIGLHPARKTVFDEFKFIREGIRSGSRYLAKRYANEPFDAEEKFYRETPHQDWTLYHCCAFARRNSEHVNSAFDEWWDKCLEFTNFDQSQFTYIVNEFGLSVNAIPFNEFSTHLVDQGHGIAAKLPFRRSFTKAFPRLMKKLRPH